MWSGAGGPVRIALLDAGGRLLREARSMETAGAWSWDGTDATGRPVAAGIYFIRVSDGEAAALRRLLRLR